jgi:hypothetical protein
MRAFLFLMRSKWGPGLMPLFFPWDLVEPLCFRCGPGLMNASRRDARLVAARFVVFSTAPRRGARFQNRKKATAMKGIPHRPFFSSISSGGKASTPPGCKDHLTLSISTKRACLRHAGSSITVECLQDNQIMMDHFPTFSMEVLRALDVPNKKRPAGATLVTV